ncbi:hypothetical protein ELY21_05400 [Legionella sp. km535]|uniref:hypothetical protein n=1 Tax=Legionella sp. km535 TaxID=2498107 RepID=UPI000F8D4193|nr:hypothetical protein [Legionella sp. km535]RUR19314.1 hypothetical protein ELY21_05400 [Legionella sp. km535]
MSASQSDLKDKLIEDRILELVRKGLRDSFIFDITANPPVTSDQWFIRKSSMPYHVTLGIQQDGKPLWVRVTEQELNNLLDGSSKWLKNNQGILELSKLIFPPEANNLMFPENKTKPASAEPYDESFTVDEKDLLKVIREEYTSFLIFECDANPIINSEQWFLRKSKNLEHITLGLQTNGEINMIELTTSQLDELLAGTTLPEVGYKLELSKMVVPKEAKDCIYQLQRSCPRFFAFVGANDNKHPAFQSFVLR